jgi:F420-dependent oxidoreductase-like protein
MHLGIFVPYTDIVTDIDIEEFVKRAESIGYDSVWVPEAYGYDSVTLMTRLILATTSIKVASGIINVFSRTPALIAQTAAALDVISGGRFWLGLGTSGPQVVEKWHGLEFKQPLQRLKESIDIMHQIWKRQKINYQGKIFHIENGLKLLVHPKRDKVPIFLGSLTPKGLKLVGQCADGWLPILFSPEHYEKVFLPYLQQGVNESSRSLEDIVTCPCIAASISDDKTTGMALAKQYLALYVGGMGARSKNFYNELVSRYGFEKVAKQIQDLYLSGEREQAAKLVPDELVYYTCLIGSPEEIAGRLADYKKVGINYVVLMPLAYDLKSQLEGMKALYDLAKSL